MGQAEDETGMVLNAWFGCPVSKMEYLEITLEEVDVKYKVKVEKAYPYTDTQGIEAVTGYYSVYEQEVDTLDIWAVIEAVNGKTQSYASVILDDSGILHPLERISKPTGGES